MHHLEPPSGIEVLKRLLKRKFIEEFDDSDEMEEKSEYVLLKMENKRFKKYCPK